MSMDRFGKQQILRSASFTVKDKDVLNVVLDEHQSYTLDEAKELIRLFLNKEVI